MTTTAMTEFPQFPALPAELRLQIWREAISLPAVLALVRDNTNPPQAQVQAQAQAQAQAQIQVQVPATAQAPGGVHNDGAAPRYSLKFVGPAPYQAGLACREARQVLEKACVRLSRPPGVGFVPTPSTPWIDLDRTVVYFDGFSRQSAILHQFGAESLSRLRHVALRWYSATFVVEACQLLASLCPSIRTIIIQQTEILSVDGVILHQPFVEDAVSFATIPHDGWPDHRVSNEYLIPLVQGRLSRYFGSPAPRVYVLPILQDPPITHYETNIRNFSPLLEELSQYSAVYIPVETN